MISRGVLALVSAAVSVAVVLPAAPAQAAAIGTLTSPGPGVLYDDCRYVEVPYSLQLDPRTESWSMDVEVYAPDGTQTESDFLFSSGGDASTGVSRLQFCGDETPGTYVVRAAGEFSYETSDSYVFRKFTLPETTFSMREPRSRTSVSTRFAKKVSVVTATSTDERPNGYFASTYETVRLQSLVSGSWRTIAQDSTDHRGRAVFKVLRTKKPKVVRVVTVGGSSFVGSTSGSVRLR